MRYTTELGEIPMVRPRSTLQPMPMGARVRDWEYPTQPCFPGAGVAILGKMRTQGTDAESVSTPSKRRLTTLE